MIHTDGIRTIAHRPPTASQRIRQARALREAALDKRPTITPTLDAELDQLLADLQPNRGPQANGVCWNDDVCICGGIIADSPAGNQCWDCFNHEPGE